MKNILAIVCGLALLPALFMGCSKLNKDNTTPEQDASAVMANSLQLPLPDNSYSMSSVPPARAATNFGNFAQTVDAVALRLQESQLHLQQTLDQGKRDNGSLHVTLDAQGTDLTGTRNDAEGKIAWTYKHSGVVTFTGSEAIFGSSGDLTFPVAGLTVHWDLSSATTGTVKNITVRHDASGSKIALVVSFKADGTISVEMTGLKNGTLAIIGKWDSTGGSYQEGANPPSCWGPSPTFLNVVCPASTAVKSK